jgi:ribosomal protein S18 acetylase RimI-like enzyme
MLFTLSQLKANGCKQAYLRVHVKNSPAICLYESLGFSKAERYKTLIWTRKSTRDRM